MTGSISRARGILILVCGVALFFSFHLVNGYISYSRHGSYLPEIDRGFMGGALHEGEVKTIENSWYVLKYDGTGNIKIESIDGKPILSDLVYYYEDISMLRNRFTDWREVKQLNDSTLLLTGAIEDTALIELALTVSGIRPRLDICAQTTYLTNVTVNREALIAKFIPDLSQLYKKNRTIDEKPFSDEYWLDKEGVRFGYGSASAFVYHTTGISSLQVRTKGKLLFVNLDLYLDHPLIRIPYQEDGGGQWEDISASKYSEGMKRVSNFSIFFGTDMATIPRLMMVPNGYLAGYIFTEHADGGNMKTHRAAYFGSEKIVNKDDATQGFTGHQIPVTKSVFFTEFDEGLLAQTDSTSAESEYFRFLDQIHTSGCEICLHTPDGENSNRSYLREAIAFMKRRFDTRTWIDHGMFQGNINRESFSADGLDSVSQYYAGDLWKEYNTRYFWSPAVETIRLAVHQPSMMHSFFSLEFQESVIEFWGRYTFSRLYRAKTCLGAITDVLGGSFHMLELNSQRPFMGNPFPTPLYWQNPTYSGALWSWPTEFDYNGITRRLDAGNLKEEFRQIDSLIEQRGVFFNHGYYVRNGLHDEILSHQEGVLTINPYFDQILSYMDKKRSEGDLHITTVGGLLDYWLMTDNVVFDYKPNGSVDVINRNHEVVRGLSLALNCTEDGFVLTGAEYKSKRSNDDTIVWFDLPAAGKVNIEFDKIDDK